MEMFSKGQEIRISAQMFDEIGGEFDAVSIAILQTFAFPPQIEPCLVGLVNNVDVETNGSDFSRSRVIVDGCCQKIPNLATQMGNQGPFGANYFQFKLGKTPEVIKDYRNDRPYE